MNQVIFGLGGAGAKLAKGLQEATGLPTVAINTDQSAVERANLDYWIAIGPKICRGRGAGNPQLGIRAATESQSVWSRHLKEIDSLIMTVGLGGGAGTGAAIAIADYARQKDIKVYCAATLPFEFEKVRRQYAIEAIEHLKNLGVKVVTQCHAETMEKTGLAESDMPEILNHTNQALLTRIHALIG